MTLVSISRETLPQFVERIGGRASATSIASRFGWDIGTARQEMAAAILQGRLKGVSHDEVGVGDPLVFERRGDRLR